ncbi:MAG: TonB-dependent receptor [Balneola sp.]
MKKILLLFFVSSFSATILAQNFTISGYVKDKLTGEVLIGANIYNTKKENGTATNSFGFFSYTSPSDTVELVISYIGFSVEKLTFFLDKNTELNIELVPGDVLDEIVVTAEEERVEDVTQMSRVTIPIQQIKSMPRLLGEVDVLKALQMIPGVQSGAEGTSGLYVRGGGPDQNLILLDGVPVYNASHLFGFVSVFNADAINNVNLVKGGFPARYGGRLSSVVDIALKEGNTEKLKGEGSIGIISSKLTLDGPISDKTTFLVSGRRTYIDLLARPFIKAESGGDDVGGYYFYDLNTKINHRFSEKDRVYLSGYFGKDRAYAESRYSDSYFDGSSTRRTENEDDFDLEWGNFTTALRWNRIYTPRLFGNVTLTYSRYLFDISERSYSKETYGGNTEIDESSIRYFSGINDVAGKVDYEFIPSPNHHIRFGSSVIGHKFNPGVLAFKSNVESDTTLGEQKTRSTEFFVYAEDDIQLLNNLSLNIGAHFSGFAVNGELYTSLEPRLAFNYTLPSKLAIKGSYTKMTQYIHLLTNSGIGLPTDLWVPSTENVKPQIANQYAIGLAKNLNIIEVTLEGYYKKMDNLIEYEEGATYLSIEDNWQDKVVAGEGESYGAELFFQKKYGKWNGWLGYTLSWNYRKFEDVNFGKSYPYKYDRRHDTNIVFIYTPRKGVEYSFGWVYGTGNAISLPTNTYPGASPDNQYQNGSVNYYDGRNGFRMAAYHRLDISASWTKPKRWGERTWSVGVYNAYSRRNPFFVDIRTEYKYNPNTNQSTEEKKLVQYSLFPLIPSITYSFKF